LIDLAIVGAGAAGIAAATQARARGLSTIILEASDRVGGRACTVDWRGQALDLGATWLHSAERNPLVPVAERLGVDIDRSPAKWREQFNGLGYSQQEQAESWAATEAFTERLRSDPPSSDRASDALDPDSEWNGFLEALNGYLNGTSLANVSAADFMAYWDASDQSNWRLPRGLGALVSQIGNSIAVRASCAVRRVDWAAATVRLELDAGIIEARKAIVAVPTDVLASGRISFSPKIDDRLHAALQLPLGHVEKLFFELPDPDSLPANAHLLGDPRSADTGSYMLRPLGMPVVEAFFGGDWLKGLTGEDLAAKGREELGHLLGSDFAQKLRPAVHSDWQRHPFIGGSYSFARPGCHEARAMLPAPTDGPLAFAGEACSDVDFATVHGAWASGEAAVEQLFGSAG
jgi:monoamine oxidase